jgi:hypothetical protein
MSTAYQVSISMDAQTVEALYDSGYALYAFAAVQCSDQAGAPLVWMKPPFAETTVVEWPAKYAVYTASPGAGEPVVPGFSVPVALGQTLTVQPSGIGVVTEDGTAGAVTILNGTASPFRCGISQRGSGGGMAPVCVMPLYGNFSQIIVPLPQILLLFATESLVVGETVSLAPGPGVLVDLGGASQRAVSFDVNEGWDWGKATWGTPVPAGTPLAPLLVEPSPGLGAQALRFASDRATGAAAH